MRPYEDEKAELERRLRQMAEVVETALGWSIEAVVTRAQPLAALVEEVEPRVDRMERDTDDFATRLIAEYQPEEAELRHLAQTIKVTGELERMADHAVSIAGHAYSLMEAPELENKPDLERLGGLVKTMVHRSLDSFLRRDPVAAEQVLRTEEAINALRDEIVEELVALMQADATRIRQALDLILVARKLERLADHATNIAEDVRGMAS